MTPSAGGTFDAATVLRGLIIYIEILCGSGPVFFVTSLGGMVSHGITVLPVRCCDSRGHGCQRLSLMAFAKRCNSHCLHAERQTQKQE